MPTVIYPDSLILTRVSIEVPRAHTWGKHHCNRHSLVTAAMSNVLHDSPYSSVTSSLPPSSCHGTTQLHSAPRSLPYPGASRRPKSFHFTHFNSTDGSSLTFLRGRRFISYMPKAVFTTGKYTASMNNLAGPGTMTNQSFHRLVMDAENRAV